MRRGKLIMHPFPISGPDGTVPGLKKFCSVFGIEPKGLEEREAQI
jgi:light-independent protochlorophyllide reductase subunit N